MRSNRNWDEIHRIELSACDQLAPHAAIVLEHAQHHEIEPVVTARLLNQLAGYAWGRAAYSRAEPLYQRSLAIREQALGPDHPNTATSLNNPSGKKSSMDLGNQG